MVSIYPGNCYEIEYRYTGTVDLVSRATWPRLNLARLAKVLNTRENQKELNRIERGLAWDAPVGPGRYCSPRHPTHFRPSFIELNGIL